jgi:hypothetical protein
MHHVNRLPFSAYLKQQNSPHCVTLHILCVCVCVCVCVCGEGPRSRYYGRTAALRLNVQHCEEDGQFFPFFLTEEKRTTWGKPCPSATLSTTNPTWTGPESNPDLRGEKPANNRLSHGTALPYRLTVLPPYSLTALPPQALFGH